jgi:hypothetical protein
VPSPVKSNAWYGPNAMGRPHPNVAKLRKQRRDGTRRAHLKRFSSEMVKVPQTNSLNHIPEDALGLYQRNGNKIKMAPDPYLEALFPGRKPKASDWRELYPEAKGTKVLPDGTIVPILREEHNGRKVALTLAEEQRVLQMISDHGELESADKWITVYEGRITKTRITMVYNAKRTLVYFLETCLHPGGAYIRKSLTEYGQGAEQRAWLSVTNRKYVWIERIDLHPELPPG